MHIEIEVVIAFRSGPDGFGRFGYLLKASSLRKVEKGITEKIGSVFVRFENTVFLFASNIDKHKLEGPDYINSSSREIQVERSRLGKSGQRSRPMSCRQHIDWRGDTVTFSTPKEEARRGEPDFLGSFGGNK